MTERKGLKCTDHTPFRQSLLDEEMIAFKEIPVQPFLICSTFLVFAILCVSSTAHAGQVGVGIYVGTSAFYYPATSLPYYYPVAPVPYYYPPAVAVPLEPDIHVEQGPPAAAQASTQTQADGSWFYCDASKTYYPYVKQCTGGWREVPTHPPSN
jgi:hypothetical protein